MTITEPGTTKNHQARIFDPQRMADSSDKSAVLNANGRSRSVVEPDTSALAAGNNPAKVLLPYMIIRIERGTREEAADGDGGACFCGAGSGRRKAVG